MFQPIIHTVAAGHAMAPSWRSRRRSLNDVTMTRPDEKNLMIRGFNMNKMMSLTLGLTALTTLLTGCGTASASGDKSSAATQKPLRVALIQPMSHASLDQIHDTIVAQLKASGQNLEIVSLNANGETSTLATILNNEKAKGVDIVVPITTLSAQSAKTVFDGTETPIVFAAVSDPVAAGLTDDASKNITGVSDQIPSEEVVRLISHFQPNFTKIGFLYTSSETNSVASIAKAKAYCDAHGITYVESSIAAQTELPAAVNALVAKGVDVLVTLNDNHIASAMPTYVDIAHGKGIPVFVGADSMVSDGGFATVGISYIQLGEQAAELILRVAKGEAPSAIPYQTLTEYTRQVNLQAAGRLGLTLTDDQLTGFNILVEADGTNHFGE